MKDKKIAILGCGNLGLSIVNGLLSEPSIKASNLTVTRRKVASLEALKSRGVCVLSDNAEAVKNADLVIVALKPYNVIEVLEGLKSSFNPNKHIVVSLASGVGLKQLEKVLGEDIPIYRAMPNTGADVASSMTCISTHDKQGENLKLVEECFNTIGSTIVIDDALMDSATVLGACGIAYVLRFMRAMVQGGIEIGFDAKTASNIVNQTVKGAAELLIQRKEHPEFEIDKVTTPKGCTIVGLNEMEHNGFSSALIKGIVSSFEKIQK